MNTSDPPPKNKRLSQSPRAIVILGVSGSGKTTVGTLLARTIHCSFYDADDFHSEQNKQKMHHGIPLTDDDRWPWLAQLKQVISENLSVGRTIVLACSALHQTYREYLRQEGVCFVYLKGDFALFKKRLEGRKGHFFDPGLLPSQFAELEEPKVALQVDASQSPEEIVRDICRQIRLEPAEVGKGRSITA